MQAFTVHTINDESRLQHRLHTREKLAREMVRAEKRRDLQLILSQIDSDTDAAADIHSATCQPLQAELESIDEQRIADMTARRETSTNLVERQRELLAKINEANIELEVKVEANKRAKHKINQQIREIEKEMTSTQAIENELCRFASQALRDKQFILNQQLKFAVARKGAAAGFVEKADDLLQSSERRNEAENVRHYSHRLREWRLEFNDATQSLAAIQQEQAELRLEMIQPEPNELIEQVAASF